VKKYCGYAIVDILICDVCGENITRTQNYAENYPEQN